MADKDEKDWGCIRIAKLEVCSIKDDWTATRKRWHELADMCQEFTNLFWETWLVWHVANKSAAKIKTYLNANAAYKEAKKNGEKNLVKPKCSVKPLPPELSKAIRVEANADLPGLNSRVKDLLTNTVGRTTATRKAAKGVLPGWMAILLRHESVPSSTRSQPIPYDSHNSTIYAPLENKGCHRIELRIDRCSKPGGGRATSHADRCELYTKGRRNMSQRRIMDRVVSGEYEFKGSSLIWDKKNRKWFALIAYRMPRHVASNLDASKTATLVAGTNRPWLLETEDRIMRLGGEGRHVGAVRRQVLMQRLSRQQNYRYAGSANKGHGRNRALAPIWKLQQRWKDFVKTFNHNVTALTVKICVENGIGELIYMQPDDETRGDKFLSNTGKYDDRDNSSWDWFQVRSQLEYKCQEEGIVFCVVKESTQVVAAGE